MTTRLYSVEADQSGHILPPSQAVHRLAVGDTLRIYLPVGSLFAQLDTVIEVREGDGTTRVLPVLRNEFGGGHADVIPEAGGSLEMNFKCNEALNNQPLVGPVSVIVVTPVICSAGTKKYIPPESLCILSMISQKMGKVANWYDTLKAAARQNFNAVHLTPIQELGSSNSSYSIANQLRISANLLEQQDGDAFNQRLTELRDKTGLLFFTDLVLNHTASNSSFLKAHPECGFNEKNSPWLQGAIQLEKAIKNFNEKLVSGSFQASHNVSGTIESEEAVVRLIQAFKEQCLAPFNLGRWFSLDIDECLRIFRESRNKTSGSPLSLKGEELAWNEALKLVGREPKGITLAGDVLLRISRDERVLQGILHGIQERLWRKCDETYTSILDTLAGTLRYERVECKRHKVDNAPWNSILPWYFTPVVCDDGEILHLANNGWVMNWKSSEDFAGPGTLVYLSRQLVAWSDCVKLKSVHPSSLILHHILGL